MWREQLGVTNLTVNKIFNPYGNEITPGANPTGAMDYFVDLNRTVAADGKSWDKAFTTIAAAITASNASIGLAKNRWWARRNRIFVCGDGIDEDLTVLPEKTDIIGVGSDLHPFPRIIGNHTIALAKVGCRWINMGFTASGTGDLMVVPAGCHGFAMLGCTMTPTTTSTKALEITNCAHVRLVGNRVNVGAGDMAKIFAVAFSIEGLASIHDTLILDNFITATAGIHVVEATAAAMGSLIQGNTIRAVAKAINDASGDFQVVNNRWMTDIDTTTSTAGYTFNLQLAAGNIQMGVTGLCDSIPFMKIAE